VRLYRAEFSHSLSRKQHNRCLKKAHTEAALMINLSAKRRYALIIIEPLTFPAIM
jgi:hypothetical protein